MPFDPSSPARPAYHSPLDDPAAADHAWARYRRLLGWTGWLALAIVSLAWVWLYDEFGLVSIHLYIATALGLGFTVMLVGALMGLVFLSSGTGHDEAIDDPLRERAGWTY